MHIEWPWCRGFAVGPRGRLTACNGEVGESRSGAFRDYRKQIEKVKNRAQGVVISPEGHVLSVGHIAWIDEKKSFTDSSGLAFVVPEKGFRKRPPTVIKRLTWIARVRPFTSPFIP